MEVRGDSTEAIWTPVSSSTTWIFHNLHSKLVGCHRDVMRTNMKMTRV